MKASAFPGTFVSSLPFKDISQKSSMKFDDLKLIKTICNSRYLIFLGFLPKMEKYIAVKMFPFEDNKVSFSYIKECRNTHLSHENIIQYLGCEDEQQALKKDKVCTVSYVLMELAICDFAELHSLNFQQNEILGRTFFCQLVEGMSYLHAQSIAHLDIKVENLLLGNDYKLKIADFDFSHHPGHITINGRGTINYRAT
jgi:Protein kinase domain.